MDDNLLAADPNNNMDVISPAVVGSALGSNDMQIDRWLTR